MLTSGWICGQLVVSTRAGVTSSPCGEASSTANLWQPGLGPVAGHQLTDRCLPTVHSQAARGSVRVRLAVPRMLSCGCAVRASSCLVTILSLHSHPAPPLPVSRPPSPPCSALPRHVTRGDQSTPAVTTWLCAVWRKGAELATSCGGSCGGRGQVGLGGSVRTDGCETRGLGRWALEREACNCCVGMKRREGG